MPKLSGNKGEWSEIYVFLRLLDTGRLYAADENLRKMNTVFYDVLKIIRDEDIGNLEFIYEKATRTVSIFNTTTNRALISLPADVFRKEADKLLCTILNTKGTSAFSDVKAEAFLEGIGINTIKARSADKSDIRMKVHDINSGFEAVQGFSIKSRLGQPSTLINAGRTTNFIYEIKGNINDELLVRINNSNLKFKDRMAMLLTNGCYLQYCGAENKIFENNMRLLDEALPRITASLLVNYYTSGCANIVCALDQITQENPIGYNLTMGHPFYTYKFKKLLTACALGMTPATVWNGVTDATGGYIIVKENGEVLCYHLFNRNQFEDYLLKNTKFETASTKRYQFGYVYKDNNRYFIKLNLQVRFIK